MKIVTLVENTTISNEYKKLPGLCLYVETKTHKILFDLGSDDTFLHNAAKLNVDISDIDIVVISHGHIDHGGGIKAFLEYNRKAKIYLQREAFEPHFAQFMFLKFNVGLDSTLSEERFIFVDSFCKIDDEIILFADVQENMLLPKGNKTLLKKQNKKYIPDDFAHEQNMLINEDSTVTLFAGCSHNGITNIIDKAKQYSSNLEYVIAGFHLFNPISKKSESIEFITQVAKELDKHELNYHTCHCTGQKAYSIAKEILKDKLHYLSTGMEIQIE